MSASLVPPPERDLPGSARARIRVELVSTAGGGDPRRRWLPLAAAAAAVAVVGGSAVALSTPDPVPTMPAASGPATKPSPPPGSPPPPAPTSSTEAPAPPGTPSVAEVRQRCELPPQSRYVTRYVGDGAVTWLFVQPAAQETSSVCTWKVGSTGKMASFGNDWLVPPIPGGRYESARDDMMPGFAGGGVPPEYAHLERDRWVFVGKTPDAVTRVLVRQGDAYHQPGFADGWWVFHYRGRETELDLFGYDADGKVVPQRY